MVVIATSGVNEPRPQENPRGNLVATSNLEENHPESISMAELLQRDDNQYPLQA